MMTKQERAVIALCDAVVAIVRAGGEWDVPGGEIYARLMAHGCSIEQFEGLMRALVATRQVEKRGQLYFGRGK